MSELDVLLNTKSKDEWLAYASHFTSINKLGDSLGLIGNQKYRFADKLEKLYPGILSNYKGKGWNKGLINIEKFRRGVKYTSKMRNPLISIKGYRCESCGLATWLNEPIPLEVHHVDGDVYNNELSNLKLLCPNCHAFTENYRGRSFNGKHHYNDEELINYIKESSTIRQVLLKANIPASDYSYRRVRELAKTCGKVF